MSGEILQSETNPLQSGAKQALLSLLATLYFVGVVVYAMTTFDRSSSTSRPETVIGSGVSAGGLPFTSVVGVQKR